MRELTRSDERVDNVGPKNRQSRKDVTSPCSKKKVLSPRKLGSTAPRIRRTSGLARLSFYPHLRLPFKNLCIAQQRPPGDKSALLHHLSNPRDVIRPDFDPAVDRVGVCVVVGDNEELRHASEDGLERVGRQVDARIDAGKDREHGRKRRCVCCVMMWNRVATRPTVFHASDDSPFFSAVDRGHLPVVNVYLEHRDRMEE